jgi:hydrogenase expression/formation protein HypD
VDGFILPGHVSVIIGLEAYRPFFERYRIPSVVAGFEPADILQAIAMLVDQIETGQPRLENAYGRAVTEQGNPTAKKILNDVFQVADVAWRGIGVIAGSGLKIAPAFEAFDAEKRFDLKLTAAREPKGCACGEILTGAKIPPQCSLYRTVCTPIDPVGPCMVSTEGTCAAYYRYHAE